MYHQQVTARSTTLHDDCETYEAGPAAGRFPMAASDVGPGSSCSNRAHALRGPLRQSDEVIRGGSAPRAARPAPSPEEQPPSQRSREPSRDGRDHIGVVARPDGPDDRVLEVARRPRVLEYRSRRAPMAVTDGTRRPGLGRARSPHSRGLAVWPDYGPKLMNPPPGVGHQTVIPIDVHSATIDGAGSAGKRTAGATVKPLRLATAA